MAYVARRYTGHNSNSPDKDTIMPFPGPLRSTLIAAALSITFLSTATLAQDEIIRGD